MFELYFQVMETFRQFALVKSAQIIRDRATGMSKGIAVVEFHSVEHATYTVSNSSQLLMDKYPLKINYFKDSFLQSLAVMNTVSFLSYLIFNQSGLINML
jgi:RNA recognition motif-containing protein